jgi:hypothetical protein
MLRLPQIFISLIIIFGSGLPANVLLAQQSPASSTVTLRGAVLRAGNKVPLSGVSIRNSRNSQTITSNSEGIFNMQVLPGDTLYMHQNNLTDEIYVVPSTIPGRSLALMQLLHSPVPTSEELTTSLPSQWQFERSLLGETYHQNSQLDTHLSKVTADPTNMQRYIDDYMRWQQMYVLPEHGATNNFINPDRWRTFIKDWKNGKFTQESMEKLDGFPADVKNSD